MRNMKIYMASLCLTIWCACNCIAADPTLIYDDSDKTPLNGYKDLPYMNAKLSIEERIADLLPRMTLEEKVCQLYGRGLTADPFGDPDAKSFGTRNIKRLGIPGFKMGHGPHGMRVGKDKNVYSTCFADGIAIGATWDPELMEEVGACVGLELRAKDHHVNLAPTLDVVRNPLGGRTVESYSEDPYLTARIGVGFVKGNQSQGITACPKHFACNNQELNRFNYHVTVDERTLRELYLPSYKAAITEGGALCVMSAYNRINGDFCSESKHLLREILKGDWGFKRLVLSDFSATHDAVKGAKGGQDIEMNGSSHYPKLVPAVKAGEVSQEIIDEMVQRVLYVKFKLGMFDGLKKVPESEIHKKAHIAIAYKSAAKCLTLLKNDGILPFDKTKIKTLAVVGRERANIKQGRGSSRVYPFPGAMISPSNGIVQKVSNSIKIVEDPKEADAVVLVVSLSSMGEGGDRSDNHLDSNALKEIEETLAANKNTAVVLLGGTAVLMEEWIDKVPALLMAWYPGEQGGVAIADALFGDVNPGGKTPLTFPKSFDQLPEPSHFYVTEFYKKTKPMRDNMAKELGQTASKLLGKKVKIRRGRFPLDRDTRKLLSTNPEFKTMYEKYEPIDKEYDNASKQAVYKEGIFTGYRHFDKNNIEPRFPFGYGLSYTTFKYSNLKAAASGIVSVDITNTGKVKGDEIVQLYVSDKKCSVERPVKELKAFKRITLKPGETKTVKFALKDDAFAYYDVNKKGWVVEPGKFDILVGSSSRDIRVQETILK